MPDMTAMELEARDLSSTVSPRVVDTLFEHLTGALFSAALLVGGIVLVTIALTVGVVGAPVIAPAVVGWLVVRGLRPGRRSGRTAW